MTTSGAGAERDGAATALGRVALLGVLSALACSPPPSRDSGADAARLPDGEPYIQGTLTEVRPALLRVEERPADASGSAKAELWLGEETRILHRSGVAASHSDLRIGQRVSAWVSGPVRESYPVQAAAGAVVIEAEPR